MLEGRTMAQSMSLEANEPVGTFEAVFSDERGFRLWYDTMLPRVYGYLLGRCGRNMHVAEELTQETFVEAVRSRSSFRGGDSAAWLIGIARHRLVDHFRREERRGLGLVRLLQRHERQVTPLFPADTTDVANAVGALPPMQRAAIVLRYVDDLPVREVARLMGRSESSIESLLSRGRETLRREYRSTER